MGPADPGACRALVTSMSDKTYVETQEMSGRLPFGLRHYWKSHFVRDAGRRPRST